MIRVLIVDDSALMRRIMSQILSEDPEIEIVGVASDPLIAREMIKSRNPDVITLDIEMPKLDGLEFLAHLMRLRPMPVIMVSSLTQHGADKALQALELGAVDVVAKPSLDIERGLPALKGEIIAKIKAAAKAIINSAPPQRPARDKTLLTGSRRGSSRIVAIGASTGGVAALSAILPRMPADGPPILIAQHMPPGFTRSFAERLDRVCSMAVGEAADDAKVMPGRVYIAPGNRHLVLCRMGGELRCRLQDSAPVNGLKPSVDVLFDSVADVAGGAAVGVLLTGMGKDGARGLLAMRRAGAATASQDEATSLIYGMPKCANEVGAAECELPLDRLAEYILEKAHAGASVLAGTSAAAETRQLKKHQ